MNLKENSNDSIHQSQIQYASNKNREISDFSEERYVYNGIMPSSANNSTVTCRKNRIKLSPQSQIKDETLSKSIENN